jgi:hypothetical protein
MSRQGGNVFLGKFELGSHCVTPKWNGDLLSLSQGRRGIHQALKSKDSNEYPSWCITKSGLFPVFWVQIAEYIVASFCFSLSTGQAAIVLPNACPFLKQLTGIDIKSSHPGSDFRVKWNGMIQGQYSSGNKKVVAERSLSVIIQILLPSSNG